jgi:hypothetical protein
MEASLPQRTSLSGSRFIVKILPSLLNVFAVLYDGEPANEDRFLRVLRPVNLTHEEHATILLAPGLYRVRGQRQWADPADPVPGGRLMAHICRLTP